MDVDPSTDRLLPLYGNAYSDTLTSSPDTVTYICTLAQNGKIMTFSRQGEYLPEVCRLCPFDFGLHKYTMVATVVLPLQL